MADPHVVSALVRKRQVLAGLLRECEKKAAGIREQLGHVDATLRMFAPDLRVRTVKPIRPKRPRFKFFTNGEIGKTIHAALRKAQGEPLSAGDIVATVVTSTGLDAADREMREGLTLCFMSGLYRMHSRQKVMKVGYGAGTKWFLPPDADD